MRGEPQLGERLGVVVVGDPALGACEQRAVDRPGEAPLGPALRLGDRLDPPPAHDRPLVSCPASGLSSQKRSGRPAGPAGMPSATGRARTGPVWEWSPLG